jgi:hypothetical protein
MDLLSHRARTGISVATTCGILAVCVGAMALGKNQIFSGSLTSKHQGLGCNDCHAGVSVPDRQCAVCHTDADPTLIARDAHRGILKQAGTFGRQGRQKAWLGYPHLALACASCHREHDQDRRPLEQVSNAVCEACHFHHHETPNSAYQRKSYVARSSPAAKKRFEQLQGGELETWSRSCVKCHHEHGSRPPEKNAKPGEAYDFDEGEIKEKT